MSAFFHAENVCVCVFANCTNPTDLNETTLSAHNHKSTHVYSAKYTYARMDENVHIIIYYGASPTTSKQNAEVVGGRGWC